MKKIAYYLILLWVALTAKAAWAAKCPVAGEPEHWIAKYCQYKDQRGAQSCEDAESKVLFRSNCTARLHYKRALCELAISRKQRKGSADACVKDNSFDGLLKPWAR